MRRKLTLPIRNLFEHNFRRLALRDKRPSSGRSRQGVHMGHQCVVAVAVSALH
jgi:hypothetical protein